MQVVKLGGSLLMDPQTPQQFANWLDRQSKPTVVIVGGGEMVDRIRKLDQIHSLDASICHWASIAAMDIQASIVASWNSDWRLFDLYQWATSDRKLEHVSIVQVTNWLKQTRPMLPETWAVTSDSISAEVAIGLGAQRLVLLKSIAAVGSTIADWHAAGLVDDYFVDVDFDNLDVMIETLNGNEGVSTRHL
ncbi:MAG: hypothetical protein AAFN77_23405 [Planctomycetota bacterium]